MKFLLTKTCHACPSQWEGIEEESSRKAYVRFRWGNLTVSLSTPEHPDGVWGEPVIDHESFSDDLNGCMSNQELTEILIGRGHQVVFMNQQQEDDFNKAQKEYWDNYGNSFLEQMIEEQKAKKT